MNLLTYFLSAAEVLWHDFNIFSP